MAAKAKVKPRTHGLSPEVLWYLETRNYGLPTCFPKHRTPEPRNVKGAVFDAAAVDRKIAALRHLRHTKGKWAGQPLVPNAEQVAYIIAPIFGWKAPNDAGRLVRIIRDAFIEMPRKGAKALAIDTPIMTPFGWTTMGALVPGDTVFGPDGLPATVTHTSETFTGNDCYQLTTTDGRTVVADAEHLWHVRDRYRKASRGEEAWRTVTTEYLAEKGARRWQLPKQAAIQLPEADLPVDPYLLGYWLGDGATANGRIYVGDEDIEFTRSQLGPLVSEHRTEQHSGAHWTLLPVGLQAALRRAGVLGLKHIPREYLLASTGQRLALLQGLMDSDGSVTPGGKAKFSGCDRLLAEGVQELVRSLGYRPGRMGVHPAKLYGRIVGTSYRFNFHVAAADPVPFRLPRKAARCAVVSKDDRRHVISFTSIERVPSVPTRCIKVDREDGLFLAGRELMPTHNTTLVAGLGMTLAFADDEGGAEVYFGAASKDQARHAFGPLKAVAAASPTLKAAGVKALRNEITQASSSSFIKVVASDGDLAHGANVHGALIDELHVHKNGGLLEAMESGTGAREQPLVFIITTADDGQTTSVYAQRRDMIEKLAKSVLKNPYQYGVVFAADDGADPFAPETIAMANPLYPVTPSVEFMRSAASKARTGGAAALASYLRLHLGLRSGLATAYFDMTKWDLNRGNGFAELGKFKGCTAYGGLDLASVSDITCLGWVIRREGLPGYDVLLRSFIPEEALPTLDAITDKNARQWVKDGWLTTTPGDVTDYGYIKAQALKDAAVLDVVGLGYDRWNSSQLVIDLADEGLPMERVGQGYASMSGPLKEMDRLVRVGARERGKNPLFRHSGNPVLKWMADNLRPSMDAAGNVKPDKSKSINKIDGISALTMAMFVAMNVEAPLESAYESAGVETV